MDVWRDVHVDMIVDWIDGSMIDSWSEEDDDVEEEEEEEKEEEEDDSLFSDDDVPTVVDVDLVQFQLLFSLENKRFWLWYWLNWICWHPTINPLLPTALLL